MISSRLFWRLFLSYLAVHLLLGVALVWVISVNQEKLQRRQVEQRLASIAHDTQWLLKASPTPDDDQLQQIARQMDQTHSVRVTLLSLDAIVHADSRFNPQNMDRHDDRPEIVAALEQGSGAASRYSDTAGEDYLYYCVGPKRLEPPHTPPPLLIRIAVPHEVFVDELWQTGQAILTFTITAGLLGGFVTYLLASKLMRPLDPLMEFVAKVAQGNLDASLDIDSQQQEWEQLRSAFLHMQSELSQREAKLRDYSQRLETILGSMVEGVVAVNGRGTILFANQAAEQVLSFPNTDFVGRPLHEIVRYPELLSGLDQATLSGESVKREFETLGDRRRVVSIRITCLDSRPTAGTVIVARDVTELRQLETMRRDFVANVSHELKTPLAAIKAYAETLRMGALDDRENRLRFVDEIEQQAERLYRLILDLIQLARIESEQRIFERERIDLQEIVADAVDSFTRVAQSRNLQLKLVDSAQQVDVLADAEGVRTILDNLISNAIRYTPEGGRITVSCWQENQHAGFDVQDTGIGIAREHQTRVFERFYRVDKARSRDLGGTGLGLSIVKHLVQALDGHVELHSRVGYGSRFRVSFPPLPKQIAPPNRLQYPHPQRDSLDDEDQPSD